MMPTVSLFTGTEIPGGIMAESLTRYHSSVERNPVIADVFHRAGLIEKWGRGTNRVITMCREAGIAPPTFEEITGAAVVTFRVNVLGPGREVAGIVKRPGQATQSPTQSATQSTDPVERLLAVLQGGELSAGDLRSALGIKHRPTFRENYLHPAVAAGLIEPTMPDKPNSRLQMYRLTEKGRRSLGERVGGSIDVPEGRT